MSHEQGGAWFPAVDEALGGIAGGIGDAWSGATGAVFGPIANFMLKMAALAAVAFVLAVYVL